MNIRKGPKNNLDRSGSIDFSTTAGESLTISIVNDGDIDIVFDDIKGAQEFCYYIAMVARVSNVLSFVQSRTWESTVSRIQSLPTQPALSSDVALHSDSTEPWITGNFYKQNKFGLNLSSKVREYEICPPGVLSYKNRLGIMDKLDIIGVFVRHLQIDSSTLDDVDSHRSSISGPDSSPVAVSLSPEVCALELCFPNEGGRKLVVAFEPDLPSLSATLLEEFRRVLTWHCAAIIVNSASETESHPVHPIEVNQPVEENSGAASKVTTTSEESTGHPSTPGDNTRENTKCTEKPPLKLPSQDYMSRVFAVVVGVLAIVVAVMVSRF
eukprot:CAMPEP_0185034328 /NCGR_PEP_ID=MMETSP1103-20130426/24095_1 /TAXON_ID=36769 /ORGANISM="Paraphysomonas bandaiensis, Strain Caron Lab Isolate" /LENGTH=324 /DNA_ID=CAMNT_0027570943 /DNA_START=193 /DNA_END=1167 /DNA_ORIENTATION=+